MDVEKATKLIAEIWMSCIHFAVFRSTIASFGLAEAGIFPRELRGQKTKRNFSSIR